MLYLAFRALETMDAIAEALGMEKKAVVRELARLKLAGENLFSAEPEEQQAEEKQHRAEQERDPQTLREVAGAMRE